MQMSGRATPISQPSAKERFQPRNRESFLDAQARNRRATWRMSALCVAGAALMGIPLALVITPLLYGVVLIVADIVNLFWPIPPALWQQANQVARFGMVAFGWLLQQKAADPQMLAIGMVAMLGPGILVSISIWLAVERMFRRSGIGGALLALNAREPNATELKELQLSDVVQEMAIAAGLPAPKIMLIDSPAANAAVIGASADDARLVISRGLIDDLSRDELAAVLAHLIASIGNGDLRIAVRMTSIFEASGLLVAFLNAPFGPQSRRTLWRLIRYCFRRKDSAQESAAVAELLARTADVDNDDIDHFFDTTAKKSWLRSLRTFVFFPFFLTNTAVKLLLWFCSLAVLRPSLGLLWRARQYLADASAVQLTRDPDSLARALQKLNEQPANIPGGDWASHLFLVSPRPAQDGDSTALTAKQKQVVMQAWTATAQEGEGSPANTAELATHVAGMMRAALGGDPQALARLRVLYQSVSKADPALAAQFADPDDLIAARQGDLAALARLQSTRRQSAGNEAPAAKGKSGDSTSFALDFHPPLKRRLKRLARMGANVEVAGRDRQTAIVVIALAVLLGPFALLAVGLLLLLIAVLIVSSVAFTVIWLAVIHQVFLLFGPH